MRCYRAAVVHEDPDCARVVALILVASGWECTWHAELDSVQRRLREQINIMVCDLAFPGALGDVLPRVGRAAGVQFIVGIGEVHRPNRYRRHVSHPYGVDDIVHYHHLVDELPVKIRAFFGEEEQLVLPGAPANPTLDLCRRVIRGESLSAEVEQSLELAASSGFLATGSD